MKKLLSLLLSVAAVFFAAACGPSGNASDSSASEDASQETVLTFFNVGAVPQVKGSASCNIIEDSGKLIVIDAGLNVSATEEKITQFLRKKGYEKIDYFILTHAHIDHIGGMPYLIDRFDIGEFYAKPCKDWSQQNEARAQADYENVISKLKAKTNEDGSKPVIVEPEQEVTSVRVSSASKFTIYYRQAVYDGEPTMFGGADKIDYNAYSFGVKYESEHVAAYFGGDAPNFLDEVLIGKVGKCQVMAAPHHGTTGPYSSQRLIDEIKPEYTIIAGLNVNFGADTRTRYEASGSKIYTNEDYGTIILTAKNKTIGVKTEKTPE